MAIYVDLVTLEEQLDSLLTFANSILPQDSIFPLAELQNLFSANKTEECVRLLSKNVNHIFQVSEKATESFFMEFCCILKKFDDEKFNVEITTLVIEQITSVKTHPQLRLKIISNFYNFFPSNSNFRYNIFESLLRYSLESKIIESIIPHFASVPLWLSQWGASKQQERTLLKIMHDILNSSPKYQVEAYKILLKYLNTFEDSDEETLATALETATQAAVQAIKLDDVHQCDDLLELKAIKQLQSNGKTEKLYELLSLFAGEKLDSFDIFHQKYPSYLEEVGLSHEDCLKKIRLLSLATLSAENSEIKYSKIAETLNIPLDEVEDWVISSICAGLLEAKMDQLRQVVVVQRCTQRVFTNAHWGQLKDTIEGWRNNVSDLLQVLRSSKQIAQV